MAEELDPKLEAIIDQAVRDHARSTDRVGEDVMDHPTADTLVDFHGGLLEGEEAEAVRTHLKKCEECAYDLSRLGTWDPATPADPELLPSEEEVEQQRRRFEDRLVEEGLAPKKAASEEMVAASVVPLHRERRPRTVSQAMAAILALAALGVGFWLGTLGKSPPGPQIVDMENPLFQSLTAEDAGSLRSSGEEIPLSSEFDALVLRLLFSDLTPHETYKAEVTSASGKMIRRWDNLPRQPSGTFVLTLLRKHLDGGIYTVTLSGRDGETETALATYRFIVALNSSEP